MVISFDIFVLIIDIKTKMKYNANIFFRTFLIGYGTPPSERFSNLVIMIISIGLGLPLIILIATGLYLCIRKLPKRHSDTYLSQ